jgi:hypothetical protein
MKSLNVFLTFIVIVFVLSNGLKSQTSGFDLSAYQQFLQQHQNMTTAELLAMYPAGSFRQSADISWESVLYHDSIEIQYNLTDYEKSLIEKHGFLVSERLRQDNFAQQYLDVWIKDLPVFISSDAILHAFHYSYVDLLQQIEKGALIGQVTNLLDDMHQLLPDLAAQYAATPAMAQMLKDVDVYLTVPRILLGENISPYYPENSATVDEILNLIYAEQFDTYPFFSENCKEIDFSQFRPRGHYAEDEELQKYFRAMVWLGRIEIYLLPPLSEPLICLPQTSEDVQRQIIDAVLILELMDLAGVNSSYEETEEVLLFMVGEQDNVTPPNLRTLTESLNLTAASQLLDTLLVQEFQDSLKTKSWAFQRILSQVLAADPLSPESVVPASAFMLFGQRFVIDSYVTGSVVFDKILYNGNKICRLFPSTLDILFAHGNSAAAQLLIPELDQYYYSTNLAALRYLIDSYDEEFWNSSIYTMWLNTVRTLNPPDNRDDLPVFMQTGAWWQQKMNTQLSSWTELRHDHLLYAKQSYTSGFLCSYLFGFVEPVPQMFESLRTLAELAHDKFLPISFSDLGLKSEILDYFNLLQGVTDTLAVIAGKELSGSPLDPLENSFVKSILFKHGGPCGPLDGWYLKLLFGPSYEPKAFYLSEVSDYLVADYHTTPTDCFGNIMGWVSHAGTGPVDLAIVTATLPDSQTMAFVGPVMGYYEYTTTNFLRLTDQEWEETYRYSALRPDWVNVYLADSLGESRGAGGTLITGIHDETNPAPQIPATHLIARNYPNPFNASTIISFSIPSGLTNSLTELTVYNIQGQVVKSLLKEKLSSGNYLTKWDGTNNSGEQVASGLYFYALTCGDQKYAGKMVLTK